MSADTEPTDDLSTILPTAGKITVAGIPARVKRLRSRELLSMLQIVTTGFGSSLGDAWDQVQSADAEDFGPVLSAMLLNAIPRAQDEFAGFFKVVVEPVEKADGPRLLAELDNPDLFTLMDAVTVIVAQEKDDLAELLGKARAALTMMQGHKKPTTKPTKT